MATNTTTANTTDPTPDPLPSPTDAALARHQAARHHGCLACGGEHVGGIRLPCAVQADGSVAGDFEPQAWMSGYNGRLHGGLVAMVLDSAMTQCLFAHDRPAVTAVLHTRYRKPAPLVGRYHVQARLVKHAGDHYRLTAQLRLDHERIADAEAQFVTDPAAP